MDRIPIDGLEPVVNSYHSGGKILLNCIGKGLDTLSHVSVLPIENRSIFYCFALTIW